MKKKTIVVHSGGMDSSICLLLAIEKYGKDNVLSLGFSYGQRHSVELDIAKKICEKLNVDRVVINLECLTEITDNALINSNTVIEHKDGESPNTLVVGRNGLMARVAAIHAEHLGADSIYMGVIEVEEANSGYRDCSRKYMDIIQEALRLDFANPGFCIETPLVFLTKRETMELVNDSEMLRYLLETTISCYEGVSSEGCQKCPACSLRNQGIREYLVDHSDFNFSYKDKLKV